jgi:hypothetical protein
VQEVSQQIMLQKVQVTFFQVRIVPQEILESQKQQKLQKTLLQKEIVQLKTLAL